MSEYVKVNKEGLTKLIDAAYCARSLLDSVHCYDTEVYETLGEVIQSTWEEIE